MRQKTQNEVYSSMVESLNSTLGLDAVQDGSAMSQLLSIVSGEISDIHTRISTEMYMKFIAFATGPFLDYLAAERGIERRSATYTSTSNADGSIVFYTKDGSLDNYLPNNIIPTGTKVSVSFDNRSYTVIGDHEFDPGANSISVAVQADDTGPEYNVRARLIDTHNLNTSDVYVTNRLPLSNGEEEESDSSLRSRVASAFTASSTGNWDAVRSAIQTIPGISDIVQVDFYNGVRTSNVIVVPVDNIIPRSTILEAQEAVDRIAAAGSNINVVPPRYARFYLKAAIETRDGSYDREYIRTNSIDMAESFLSGISIGETFNLSTMLDNIRISDDNIIKVDVICAKINNSPMVSGVYKLDPDEVIIPDSSTKNPVEFII